MGLRLEVDKLLGKCALLILYLILQLVDFIFEVRFQGVTDILDYLGLIDLILL